MKPHAAQAKPYREPRVILPPLPPESCNDKPVPSCQSTKIFLINTNICDIQGVPVSLRLFIQIVYLCSCFAPHLIVRSVKSHVTEDSSTSAQVLSRAMKTKMVLKMPL